MLRFLFPTAAALLLSAGACVTEDVPFCEENPDDASCECWDSAAGAIDMECECMRDPGAPACVADGGDAGDAGDTGMDAADTAVDAGPCGGDCPAGQVCRTDDDMCVDCLMDSDCDELSAPQCNTTSGTCEACTASMACTGRTGTEVCADTGANMGSCVACTVGEAGACGGNACTADNACSAYGAAQGTCEPCDTDENCGDAEHFCVPMEFPAGTARATGYCLKATPGCPQPHTFILMGRTSLSGMGGQNYCGVNEALTTCEAVNALEDNVTCPMGMDSECPEGGVCATLDPTGAALTNRCTYRCMDPTRCKEPTAAGSTCGDGGAGGDDYCGG